MATPTPVDPAEFLDGHPTALAAYRMVCSILGQLGPFDVRVTKSQVAFRRRRGFAYLWMPGQYLTHPGADVVLSIALGRRDNSPRWKQVAHPAPTGWMHHLELRGVADLDDEVRGWLSEAADRAD